MMMERILEEILAYREDLLAALEGVVQKISEIVSGIPSEAWHQQVGSNSHSPHYTLAHLRALEGQVFAIQLRRILAEETPVLPIFDDEAWMAQHYQPEETAQAILEDFTELRKQELAWLRVLPSAPWSLLSRHPWWGVHTLQWWVELQLDYSNQHLRELSRSLDM